MKISGMVCLVHFLFALVTSLETTYLSSNQDIVPSVRQSVTDSSPSSYYRFSNSYTYLVPRNQFSSRFFSSSILNSVPTIEPILIQVLHKALLFFHMSI